MTRPLSAVLVVAKMPVPGEAKTRLAEAVGPLAAADLAAAALLDTLAAVAESGLPYVVACTGDLHRSARRAAVTAALADASVVPQRGSGFGQRLTAAHHDAARLLPRHRVLQIGMDTPQVSSGLLSDAARHLADHDAVLGPASDGGWWALGVSRPDLTDRLADVPMSHPDTGRTTYAMLVEQHARVGALPELADVDTIADARLVMTHPTCGARFADAMAALPVEVP